MSNLKITGNESAYPLVYATECNSETGAIMKQDIVPGLTIRQQFAMNAKPDLEGYSMSYMEKIIGRERPEDNNKLEVVKFLADFKATLQVIEADALIAALNK